MKPSLLLFVLAGVSVAMMFAPTIAARRRTEVFQVALLAGLAAWTLFLESGHLAYGMVAISALIHAELAWKKSKVGAVFLGLSAAAATIAAFAIWKGMLDVAFVASVTAIVIRAAVLPLHVGIADLCERAPHEQVRQLASLIPLVMAHLAFLEHAPMAHSAQPVLFMAGSVAALLPGLAALTQRDLPGLYRMTTMMHGGYMLAAVGAAGHGHDAAAIFALLTLVLGVGGFGLIVDAVQARSGRVLLTGPGGRVAAFPHLAGAFAVLGAAGVGLPATAGFVADDLLLHAAWESGVVATGMLIVASVGLAIGTARGYSRVFLGPPTSSVAPDMLIRERVVVVAIIAALLVLGIAPQFLIRVIGS